MTQESGDDDPIECNRARIAALVAGDYDRLERYVGADMQYVSGDGAVRGKDDVFDAFRRGTLRVERQDPSEEAARVYGDTAIVSYRADSVTVDRGRRIEGATRSTSVYVRRDGRWQLVLQHNTPIG